MKIKQVQSNTLVVSFDGIRKGWEQWVLLRTDVHHDNPKCDQALEKKHLDQAKARGALIIDNGDLFCAMQGKYDKRSSKEALRPEHQVGNYFDALVNTAAKFYEPYAENFILLGKGNHETRIRDNHETDLIDRLAAKLREKGSQVVAGGYGGWVKFNFNWGRQGSIILYHFHGTGGGGPVTRGTIQTSRIAVMTPDAHIVLTGHTHDSWTMPIKRQRLSDRGVTYQDEQFHIRCGGYKDAWGEGAAGWEVEKMLGPKPKDAAWLRFYYDATDGGSVKFDHQRAT